ncbi:MAG: tail assembly chaperone [Lachnospiraceae bacterium]|nr:tail assembly chaperone [Lachnospiraceae bacterium]
MFELTMNGQVYQFHFGIGFLKEINKKISTAVPDAPSIKKNIGLRYYIASIFDGDIEALTEVLFVANKGQNPRLTMAAVEAHLEDDDTDIDKVFEDVMGFLEHSNVTKKTMKTIKEAVASEMAKQEKKVS